MTARAAWAYVINTLILFGASLIAAQVRLTLPWGNQLGPEYDSLPMLLGIILLLAGAIAYSLAVLAESILVLRMVLTRKHYFRVTALSITLTLIAIRLLLPEVSKLQLGYFGVISVVLGLFAVLFVNRISDPQGIVGNVRHLLQNLFLLKLWLAYSIQMRYSQTLLGILWIMFLPLATATILSIAFSQFLKIRYDVPFISFFLAAIVPWNMVQSGILGGLQSIISKAGILSQVGFPREILVLLAGGEVLVDTIFTFGALLVVDAANGIWPNPYFVYLPYLLFIVIAFTLGLMLITSGITVFIRDIPQLVTVGLQLVFYLTPIVYPIASIPDSYKALILLNPMVSVIQAFRDVIVYSRAPNLITLNYPLVIGTTLLFVGYAFFKGIEDRIADIL